MTSSEQYLRSQQDGLGVVKRAGYGRAMTLEPWAKAQAERLIAPLGDAERMSKRSLAKRVRRAPGNNPLRREKTP
jgi:hypothetical protein